MRKKKRTNVQPSNLIQIAMIAVAVLLVLANILISLNLSKSKDQLTVAKETNVTLQRRLDNLAPNKITLPTGKFPLEANEKLLDKAYNQLMNFVYQKTDSTKFFEANKKTLIQYFSQKGYDQLKQETLLQNGSKIESLSSKLLSSSVTFSNFNLKDKTVDVTIYSHYQLANPVKDAKTGVSIINLIYNFDSLSVTNFDMRSTNIDSEKVF